MDVDDAGFWAADFGGHVWRGGGCVALATALGDVGGAKGLFWVGIVALILLVVDVLLLVGVLGVQAMERWRDEEGP